MNKFAIALVLGAVFAVGCGDKAADGAKSGAAASGSAKSGGGTSGSKVCDDYWAKQKACNEKMLKDVPDGPAKDASKKTMDETEAKTKESWKEFKGDALDQACKSMLDALASNPVCK